MKVLRQYIYPRLVVDIFFFYILLMLFGWFAARVPFELPFILGAIANYLMLVFAFVYNDIEDREDDAKTTFRAQTWQDNLRMMVGIGPKTGFQPGEKRFLNIFGHNVVSVQVGYIVCLVIVLAALVLSYIAGGLPVVIVALSNLVFGYLYSSRKIRLKSIPGFDVFSHAYLLAGVQVIYFLAYPGATIDFRAVAITVLVFINSLAGDLRNEYRDFEEDQEAGIRNTATIVGKKRVFYGAMILNVVSMAGLALIVLSILLNRI